MLLETILIIMKQIFLAILFFVNLTYSFSQKGADPFDLPSYTIKQNNIKTISEYDGDTNKIKHAIYDLQGNQIYYNEDDRVIEFELDYDQNGYLKEELAVGFRHEVILKKRHTNNSLGQIDSIYYVLPLPMYYEGFIEKYNYHKDGRINNINVYSVPKNRLMFQHKYEYGVKNELGAIRTLGIYEEDSVDYFTKEFTYYQNGDLMSSLQLTANKDTIAISYFNGEGLLTNEIISHFYTTPHSYMYSSTIYFEALKELDTPLTSFLISKNIKRKKYGRNLLIYINHQYENGQLLKSIKSVKNKKEELILSTENYKYNAQNELIERLTIDNTNQNTTIVKFSKDQIQRYIGLHQNSQSYLTIKEETSFEYPLGELIIEGFYQKWKCKTTTEFDTITNTVTKKRFCLDSEGIYPSKPEQITVANFDANGRQINHNTFYESKKASKNVSYTYANNGALVQYEFNGLYWKYYYSPNDSMLVKLEYYKDSIYENLVSYYTYEYDSNGSYSVSLVYLNEDDISSYYPTIQQFDTDGKILKKEWIRSRKVVGQTINYIYNELGLCTESIFERGNEKNITRYKYEFH